MSAALPPFDENTAEAFSATVAETIDAAAVAIMISVGHRTGLFDVMAGLKPSRSGQIAEAAQLTERYVREWLAVMVTGGIVNYDPETGSYHFPPEHAACLTRGAPLGNFSVAALAIPLVGGVEDRILSCFETGEGTQYGDYPCFHHMMAEDSAQTVVAQLFDIILPLVPELQDRLEQGIDVLDAGCGSGRALVALAARYSASHFTGYDLSKDAIESAKRSASAAGLHNTTFEVRDLTDFDSPNSFDFVTSFDAVHDQKDPQSLLTGLYKSLRQDGVYLMQDIGGSAHLEKNMDFPMASFLYMISCMHCMPVSIGQGGQGLGTMWGWETAEEMLKIAGFSEPERHVLPHDPMNVWFVSRKNG
ncbi:class I SAM-dependent methyltransferase [Pelagibius sp. Alg239-R121]|uniref:class I SAM-dependent methyltransferase n=1 Tax=Pelagibius sp. Alg239-R121 TaxID=2993448 RepID=UPI0024A726C5|nr:class I SAM-dependent methyltransferase [Pelagibius sp. Alg239-R121]